MWANNETGVLFPVKEIAEICRSRGSVYHCDAVQAAGKVEIDLSSNGVKPTTFRLPATSFMRRKVSERFAGA